MTEEECLAEINNGATDARELLDEAMPSAARRFKAIDRAIVKLLADVKDHFPDAEYYTASGGFHLLLGSSHSAHLEGQQELTALSGLAHIGDGDY